MFNIQILIDYSRVQNSSVQRKNIGNNIFFSYNLSFVINTIILFTIFLFIFYDIPFVNYFIFVEYFKSTSEFPLYKEKILFTLNLHNCFMYFLYLD